MPFVYRFHHFLIKFVSLVKWKKRLTEGTIIIFFGGLVFVFAGIWIIKELALLIISIFLHYLPIYSWTQLSSSLAKDLWKWSQLSSGFLVTSFPYILYKHLFNLFPQIFPFFFYRVFSTGYHRGISIPERLQLPI